MPPSTAKRAEAVRMSQVGMHIALPPGGRAIDLHNREILPAIKFKRVFHYPFRERFFREAARVSRLNGHALFADFCPSDQVAALREQFLHSLLRVRFCGSWQRKFSPCPGSRSQQAVSGIRGVVQLLEPDHEMSNIE